MVKNRCRTQLRNCSQLRIIDSRIRLTANKKKKRKKKRPTRQSRRFTLPVRLYADQSDTAARILCCNLVQSRHQKQSCGQTGTDPATLQNSSATKYAHSQLSSGLLCADASLSPSVCIEPLCSGSNHGTASYSRTILTRTVPRLRSKRRGGSNERAMAPRQKPTQVPFPTY